MKSSAADQAHEFKDAMCACQKFRLQCCTWLQAFIRFNLAIRQPNDPGPVISYRLGVGDGNHQFAALGNLVQNGQDFLGILRI